MLEMAFATSQVDCLNMQAICAAFDTCKQREYIDRDDLDHKTKGSRSEMRMSKSHFAAM